MVMTTDAGHVLECLRAAMPGGVPPDACGLPELWRHQMPDVTVGDVVWALWSEGGARSLRILQSLLGERVWVVPRLGGVRPVVTTRKVDIARIHLVVHRNPHPPETSLHRNWFRYRENLPVDVYRRLGGSSRCLEGDVRRGLVRVG